MASNLSTAIAVAYLAALLVVSLAQEVPQSGMLSQMTARNVSPMPNGHFTLWQSPSSSYQSHGVFMPERHTMTFAPRQLAQQHQMFPPPTMQSFQPTHQVGTMPNMPLTTGQMPAGVTPNTFTYVQAAQMYHPPSQLVPAVTTAEFSPPEIDVRSIDLNKIAWQVDSGELPSIPIINAILNAPAKLGAQLPDEVKNLKEHLLDRIINHNEMLMRALETKEDILIKEIADKIHKTKSSSVHSDNPLKDLHGSLVSKKKHFKSHRGGHKLLGHQGAASDRASITASPSSGSENSTSTETQPYRPGHPRVTRRRFITRIITRRRQLPIIRHDIKDDHLDQDVLGLRDHLKLDKKIVRERKYYAKNRSPGDPTDPRLAVPDPRQEEQYGFAPSRLYRRPLPLLDFESRLVGYQGDNLYPTALYTGPGNQKLKSTIETIMDDNKAAKMDALEDKELGSGDSDNDDSTWQK